MRNIKAKSQIVVIILQISTILDCVASLSVGGICIMMFSFSLKNDKFFKILVEIDFSWIFFY